MLASALNPLLSSSRNNESQLHPQTMTKTAQQLYTLQAPLSLFPASIISRPPSIHYITSLLSLPCPSPLSPILAFPPKSALSRSYGLSPQTFISKIGTFTLFMYSIHLVRERVVRRVRGAKSPRREQSWVSLLRQENRCSQLIQVAT